jgi:hypothetical protein
MLKRPPKKSDAELFTFIEQKIREKKYIFTSHAQQRGEERNISDLDVLNILENKNGYSRTRNKQKDTYEAGCINEQPVWRYCIEGNDIDENKIRLVITFDEYNMLIVTVIKI